MGVFTPRIIIEKHRSGRRYRCPVSVPGPRTGHDTAASVRSTLDLPSPNLSSCRGDGELFGFMVSVVFLMDRRPNCNLQIFLLDSIDR